MTTAYNKVIILPFNGTAVALSDIVAIGSWSLTGFEIYLAHGFRIRIDCMQEEDKVIGRNFRARLLTDWAVFKAATVEGELSI